MCSNRVRKSNLSLWWVLCGYIAKVREICSSSRPISMFRRVASINDLYYSYSLLVLITIAPRILQLPFCQFRRRYLTVSSHIDRYIWTIPAKDAKRAQHGCDGHSLYRWFPQKVIDSLENLRDLDVSQSRETSESRADGCKVRLQEGCAPQS